jgi:hypothetical protein
MSTIADWDADVAAQIVTTTTAAMSLTAVRYDSDVRRGRIETGEVRFQARHGQQGEDSSLDSAVSYAVVASEMELYYRLDAAEAERTYTLTGMRLLQATLSLASTWRGQTSVYNVIDGPVISQPEAVSLDVIGFTITLSVLLAP